MGRKGRAFPHSRGRSPIKHPDHSLIWTALRLAAPTGVSTFSRGQTNTKGRADPPSGVEGPLTTPSVQGCSIAKSIIQRHRAFRWLGRYDQVDCSKPTGAARIPQPRITDDHGPRAPDGGERFLAPRVAQTLPVLSASQASRYEISRQLFSATDPSPRGWEIPWRPQKR
jgi:hypothetical protein